MVDRYRDWGPVERRAARSLWMKRAADRLADGPRGVLAWRWHVSRAVRGAWRLYYGRGR